MTGLADQPSPNTGQAPPQLHRPPSLRRVGQVVLALKDTAGLEAPLGHRYHLAAGRLYILAALQPMPGKDAEPPVSITVVCDELLKQLTLLPPGTEGNSATCTYTFLPQLPSRWGISFPLPAWAELTVVLTPTDAAPVTHSLPVVIWPSFWHQLWWLIGLAILLGVGYWTKLLQDQPSEPLGCATQVLIDPKFLLQVASLVVGLLLFLKAVGLCWLRAASGRHPRHR
jgi:hypothetical protein